jgi:hypothetical protein
MARIYEATWDETYVSPGTRTLSEKHFHSDNGYEADDLQQIKALALGEQAELDGNHLVVKRIQ